MRAKDSALSNEQLASLDTGDTVRDPANGAWEIHVADHNGKVDIATGTTNHEVVAVKYNRNGEPYIAQLLNARNSVDWRIAHRDEP